MLDDGEGFESGGVARRRLDPLDGGRGLMLMRALVDRLQLPATTEDGRHGVILEKRLSPQPRLRLLS